MSDRSTSWPATEELARLVGNAQQGQAGAIDVLLRALRRPILRLFKQRLPHDDAEDLTQLALVRIAKALPRIEPARADRYIRAVARNLLRTAFRTRALEMRRFTSLVAADSVDTGEDLEALVEYHEILDRILESSRTSLPVPLREVVLGLIDGETASDIAAQQMVNPITVRTRLLRARALLRLYLDSYGKGW